jgi:two-component system, OmpR family, response regulator
MSDKLATVPGAPVDPRVVAIVDDDPSLTQILAAALSHHGFSCRVYQSGRAFLGDLGEGQVTPMAVVLDVAMPDLDGIETCRRIRRDGWRVPVLFLSALGGPADRVRGLNEGGDDYVTKPFFIDEVVARLRIISGRRSDDDDGVHSYADLRLDVRAHRVSRCGREVLLTKTEFRLLRYLLENAERVVGKPELLRAVWGYPVDGDVAVVETYVYYLRRKIDVSSPKLIHTVRGAGYALRLQP